MWIITSLIVVLVLNTAAAIVTVFKQQRDISATWAWLLVLLLLPVLLYHLRLFWSQVVGQQIAGHPNPTAIGN